MPVVALGGDEQGFLAAFRREQLPLYKSFLPLPQEVCFSFQKSEHSAPAGAPINPNLKASPTFGHHPV